MAHRIRRTFPLLLAVLWLLIVVALTVFPQLSDGALTQDLALTEAAPGTAGHLLGTDALGRDVVRLTLAGSRTALVGPVVIALGAMTIGVVLGLSCAYFGGPLDWAVSRIVELMLSLPTLLLAIVIAGILGGSYATDVLVFAILYTPYEIRLVRAATLRHIHDSFLDAGKLLELSPARIMFRHLLPIIQPVVVSAVFLDMSNALVSLSSLSFLGIGISPQQADWGRQLSDARSLIYSNPAAAIAPAVVIIVTSIALNVIGDNIAAGNREEAHA